MTLATSVLLIQAAEPPRTLKDPRVEYRTAPLGIDVAKPRFSWRMEANERGARQIAYQIAVTDPKGVVVWNSQRVESANSLAVAYEGAALRPATRYGWTLTVWDQTGAKLTTGSWFETGLMDSSPDSKAWAGAQWIGGGEEDLTLYSPYLAIFDLGYSVTIAPGSTRASFVYGANDSRLMDRNKNILQLENRRDESYIKLELDVSGVDGSADGRAKLHVYRVGYAKGDSAERPFKTFDVASRMIDAGNKNAEHRIEFRSAFGQITIMIDGNAAFMGAQPTMAASSPGAFAGRRNAPNAVNLNPMGSGGDYLPFGLLCDLGFEAGPGQRATFRDVTVRNNRAPRNILFRERLETAPYRGIFADAASSGLSVAGGGYSIDGGPNGAFVVRNPSRNSAPMLRATFQTAAKVVDRARLYVTARGVYEVFLNGHRVSEDRLNPGLTQYNVTHLYQTYDVTSLVKSGRNALGAMLAEGWWSGLLSYGSVWNHFGDRQSLLAKLEVTYKDGSSDIVTTNGRDWKYFGQGPVRYASLDFGEIYDASREADVEGWSTQAYDDRKWKPAKVTPLEGTAFSGTEAGGFGPPAPPFQWNKLSLVGQIGDNAGIFRTLRAKSVKEVRPGVFVYDLGQNIVGAPRIRIANGSPGARMTVRYAEMLYPNLKESGANAGMIMTENYRAALSTDVYTMKAGPQTFEPRFTSHGFQYVEITGIEKAPPLEAVEGVVVSSVRELTAEYRTSNAKVNQLWSNLVWSNIDNFLTIPTDCPQRNERMGWSGDINVFSATATYVSNADQFLTRHMRAMRDVQSPAGRFTDVAPVGGGFGGVLWGSAGIVVPWEAYRQYKDVTLLEQHYPAMTAYLDYLESTVDPKTGLTSDAQLGDWLGPQNNALGSAYLAAAYHAYDLAIMAKAAAVLGKHADAARYVALYEKRRAAFNSTFVNADHQTMGIPSRGFGPRNPSDPPPALRLADTQTSYAVGLGMVLFNSEQAPYMAKRLAEAVARENKDDGGVLRPSYALMTGFIGTAWIGRALSENGLVEAAYRLLLNERYPSWLYAVDQGATTIWERLNGYTVENGFGGNNSMNSFNHYSFGAVGQWMLAYSLGIQRDEPGFQKFILQPEPDPTGRMSWAEGHYDSMYGRIRSSWKVEGGVLTYRATVPANTSATLYLPTSKPESVKERGGMIGGRFVKYAMGRAVYTLGPGDYEFTAPSRD